MVNERMTQDLQDEQKNTNLSQVKKKQENLYEE